MTCSWARLQLSQMILSREPSLHRGRSPRPSLMMGRPSAQTRRSFAVTGSASTPWSQRAQPSPTMWTTISSSLGLQRDLWPGSTGLVPSFHAISSARLLQIWMPARCARLSLSCLGVVGPELAMTKGGAALTVAVRAPDRDRHGLIDEGEDTELRWRTRPMSRWDSQSANSPWIL